MSPPRASTLLLALCLGSCVTESESDPAGPEPVVIVPLAAGEAWTVELDGRTIGSVIRFRERATSRAVFAVRNVHGQDLGTIDINGRAWRARPHRDPEWVGTGTVAEGVRLILGLEDAPELVPADPADLGPPR